MDSGDVEELAAKIARGECVLFSGAGLSIHAGAPDWDSLVENAMEEFDYESPLNDNFAILSDIARKHGREALHKYVRDELENVELEPPVEAIANLPWFATFTTNYDTGLEDALSEYHDSVRVVSEGTEFAISGSPSDLLCVKLMGSVEKQFDQPGSMVLTNGEKAKAQDERSRIFEMLASHAANLSFLFVGYSFRDELFTEIIERITTEIGTPPDTYYALFRTDPPEEERYYLEQLGVKPIVGELEAFSENLISAVSRRDPSDHRTKRIPFGNEVVQPSLDDIGDFLEVHDPVLYEDIATDVEPRAFFKGDVSSLKPFQNNWHFKRPEEENLLDYISDTEKNVIAVSGSPGSGRTFVISAAVQRAIKDRRAIGFRIPSHSLQEIPDYSELESFIDQIQEEADRLDIEPPSHGIFFSFVQLDSVKLNKFRRLAEDLDFPITLVVEVSDDFSFSHEIAESPQNELLKLENRIPEKRREDIKDYLIETVQNHKFPELTEVEAESFIEEDPEFLPLMYKTIDPARRSIQRIIGEEYGEITSEIATTLVNIVSLSSSLDLSTPVTVCRKALSRKKGETITFPEVFELANTQANEFISTTKDARTNQLFSIYHPVVAEYLCRNYSGDTRNILSLLVDTVNLKSRVEAEFISQLLISRGVNRNPALYSPFSREELHEALVKLSEEQPARPILHHLARLREKEGQPEEKVIPILEKALASPNEEYALKERKENILTTLANLKWRLDEDRLKELDRTHEDIREIIGYLEEARENVENGLHTYDIQARILKQMADARPREEATGLINEGINVIEEGLDRQGDPDDLEKLRQRKIELLDGLDRNRSEELAERMLREEDSGAGYYTLARLSLYENRDTQQALRYLAQSMDADDYPPEAIALRIRLMLDDDDPLYDMIYELASDLDDRPDYQDTWKSSFHKAIAYFIHGEAQSAKRHFDRAQHLAPWDLQREVEHHWMEGGSRKEFTGKIGSPLSAREGWIYAHGLEGWDDDIYFQPRIQDHYDEFRSGREVGFELGFSPRGPQAFEVKVI